MNNVISRLAALWKQEAVAETRAANSTPSRTDEEHRMRQAIITHRLDGAVATPGCRTGFTAAAAKNGSKAGPGPNGAAF